MDVRTNSPWRPSSHGNLPYPPSESPPERSFGWVSGIAIVYKADIAKPVIAAAGLFPISHHPPDGK
jgi:hypothetical protein